MVEDNVYQYASSVLYAIIQLLVIIGCIILVVKTRKLATILMLLGAILSGIMQIITPILYSYYLSGSDDFMIIVVVISLISSTFYATFGVGLFLLALNYKKQ